VQNKGLRIPRMRDGQSSYLGGSGPRRSMQITSGAVMKIVSFVAASSNSGKTTLIEKIVRILNERGLRVAVAKHASKGSTWTARQGSWRFQEAGAAAVVLVGPEAWP